MRELDKKQSKLALGVWAVIAAVIILSNNIIEFLTNLGVVESSANLLIITGIILLAFYHQSIARELAKAF